MFNDHELHRIRRMAGMHHTTQFSDAALECFVEFERLYAESNTQRIPPHHFPLLFLHMKQQEIRLEATQKEIEARENRMRPTPYEDLKEEVRRGPGRPRKEVEVGG